MLDTILKVVPRPCKEGYPFIFGAFGLTLLFLILGWDFIGTVMFVVALWVVYFFRDPDRVTPAKEGVVVSPADGVVSLIVDAVPPPQLDLGEEPLTRVSVFLNVFNVHVNRVPAAGTISRLYYYPGKFLNAELDKASEENERQMVKLETPNGQEIGFVQIAGLVARRIVCHLHEGQGVAAGERFGLIRFGSRMDVYLPKGVVPRVAVGQLAVAGETIFADLNDPQPEPVVGVRQ